MKWKQENWVDCSVCNLGLTRLNDFGVCASCWAELTPEQRAAIAGEPTEKARVVTYSLPAHPGFVRRFVSSALGSAAGGLSALWLCRWLGWL